MDGNEVIRPGKERVIITIMAGILVYLAFGADSEIFHLSIVPVSFTIVIYFTGLMVPQYQVDPRKLRASLLGGIGGSVLCAFSLIWLQQNTWLEIPFLLFWTAMPVSYIVFAGLIWKITSHYKGW
jgi:hypothetical protein